MKKTRINPKQSFLFRTFWDSIKTVPKFQELSHYEILMYSPYSFRNQLLSPLKWTPIIQRQKLSERLQEFLVDQTYLPQWTHQNRLELVDALLFEALENTGFDYKYDQVCEKSKGMPFHGVIDFMIYNKEENGLFNLPWVPVLVYQDKTLSNGKTLPELNFFSAIGVGMWYRQQLKALEFKQPHFKEALKANPQLGEIRVLMTDGHAWQLIEMNLTDEFKKTELFKPRPSNDPQFDLSLPYTTPPEFYYPGISKLYFDFRYVEVILGLIRYGVRAMRENEMKIQNFHGLIDDLRKGLVSPKDQDKPIKIQYQKKVGIIEALKTPFWKQ